jgi:hypothetical protein
MSALTVSTALAVVAGGGVGAHDGPPFPIVSQRTVGPYEVSVWTDPDATDDGSAGGQFWVIVEPAGGSRQLPPDTRATVSVRPLDRSGPRRSGRAEPDGGLLSRQFVALPLDHEGPFAVDVSIAGPLGTADLMADVEATYDLRPAPILLAVYFVPFLLAGALWSTLLIRRRRHRGDAARGRETELDPEAADGV